MFNVVYRYCELPSFLRRPLWQFLHSLLIKKDQGVEITFMNYGYQPLDGTRNQPALHERDETNRVSIQLYHHVAAGHGIEDAGITGQNVLEVGCGRGGGASYLARYLHPASYVGLDVSKRVIAFCNSHHNVPGLSFTTGRAESLSFPDGSFERVINIESSRCYSDRLQFFREVHRVLKPGGYLLFADMRQPDELPTLNQRLEESGFRIIQEEDISRNVVLALDQDSERRAGLISSKTPGLLSNSAREFAGVQHSRRYNSFADGSMQYRAYVLQRV